MPSTCQPRVSVLPKGRSRPSESACRSWKRLKLAAFLTSKPDGPLSTPGWNGFMGAVWATAPEDPETKPPITALESSSDFEHV